MNASQVKNRKDGRCWSKIRRKGQLNRMKPIIKRKIRVSRFMPYPLRNFFAQKKPLQNDPLPEKCENHEFGTYITYFVTNFHIEL
jgi:hypothetical protein